MAPWVTPPPRVSSTTVISLKRTIRSNTARRVESASARMTMSTLAASSVIQDRLAMDSAISKSL